MNKKNIFYIILVIPLIVLSLFFYIKNHNLEDQIRSLENKHDKLQTRYLSVLKEKKLLERCYDIEKSVSEIRGLGLIKSITYKVINKSRLNEILIKRFDEVYKGNSFYNMENSLKILGMIDKDVDLKTLLLKLYQEQAAAFYDYDNKIMYLVNNAFFTKRLENMFIAHELTHAVQDQHYGLVKMGIDRKDNDDAVLALSALIEGDATFVMEKFYKQNLGLDAFLDVLSGVILEISQKEIDKAPQYLKENMLFPYIKGLQFVKNIYDNNVINMENVFLNPPTTTEQILHTEKYFINRDEPDYPVMPDLTKFYGKYDLTPINENVLGELNINILLKRHLPYQLSNDAAQGWDGDRYVVFENKNNKLNGYILLTRWDSSADARQFFDAFLKWIKLHYEVQDNNSAHEEYDVTIDLSDHLSCCIQLIQNDCIVICAPEIFFPDLKKSIISVSAK
ncbi:hypothetical protein J7L67_01150 [bacterium]|nr:hypothetical protein [bacterium]